MADSYFTNFPDLYYNGKRAKDITRRVNIEVGDTTSPYIFYPYELQHQLRQDHVSEYYYDDSGLDWLILISNKILDPYFGWYNTQEQFEELIKEKYGSLETAQRKIIFYRNNWSNDPNEITVSYYNNTLARPLRKYYEPVFNATTNIISYRRKQEETVMNTNRILQFTISSNNVANVSHSIGELVDIKNTGLDATVATGEVEMANSTYIRIKNVAGNTTANSSLIKDIVGESSGANVSVSNVETWFENISLTENDFWEPIYFYDYEVELNEQKKNINLIGDGVQNLFVEEFVRQIREDVDETTGLVANT